jgi:hypothetical protein
MLLENLLGRLSSQPHCDPVVLAGRSFLQQRDAVRSPDASRGALL